MSDEHPYKVGYGRPPLHTRFQKGRSGNPRGRPKGSRNLATLIAKALDRRVAVNENGRRRTISSREAIIAELVNRSVAADLKAIAMLFRWMQEAEPPAEEFTASDQEVIAGMIARLSPPGPR